MNGVEYDLAAAKFKPVKQETPGTAGAQGAPFVPNGMFEFSEEKCVHC